jgi:hypothetical protein
MVNRYHALIVINQTMGRWWLHFRQLHPAAGCMSNQVRAGDLILDLALVAAHGMGWDVQMTGAQLRFRCSCSLDSC